jgi:pimeloyl-ACP methyl ester carboxylesterase
MTGYADTIRLSLATGCEVQALVRADATSVGRAKCVFLHGNPGSLVDWQQVAPRLSHAADTLAIDMPGFGRSSGAACGAEGLCLERLAEHAIAAADALSWREPLFLVGHSHGGGVALTAAALFPERVAGLVLVGSLGAPVHTSYRLLSLPGAALVTRVFGRMLQSKLFRPLARRILRATMRDIFSPEAVTAEELDREVVVLSERPEILASMVHVALGQPSTRLFHAASSIRCPTLFLHGERDALVPPRCAKSIHDRILEGGGRSEFQLLPGAGHMAVHYQAAEIASAILRTLDH